MGGAWAKVPHDHGWRTFQIPPAYRASPADEALDLLPRTSRELNVKLVEGATHVTGTLSSACRE
jgi:hypothetical protein